MPAIAASPIIRTSGAAGSAERAINRGFAGDDVGTAENFARLTDPNFAYTVDVPPAEQNDQGPGLAQRPDLLPQPRQHDVPRREPADGRLRRARRSDDRESARRRRDDRDLRQLDRPLRRRRLPHRHRASTSIPEFWQAFVPAMLARARGAAASPTSTSSAKSPTTMASPASSPSTRARQAAERCSTSPSAARRSSVVAGERGDRDLARAVRTATRSTKAARRRRCSCRPSSAITTPGRFAMFVRKALPEGQRRRSARRASMLGHAHAADRCAACRRSITATSRASSATAATRTRARTCSPARSRSTTTMSCSARDATTAQSNFDTDHPLYRLIRQLAAIRTATPALRARQQTVLRAAGDEPGLFAVSRFDPASGARSAGRVQHLDQADRAECRGRDVDSQRFTALAGQLPGAARRRRAACAITCRRSAMRSAMLADQLNGQTTRRAAARAVVARRGDLPDLSAQLRRLERRRHRRPAGRHRAARPCRRARRRRDLAVALLHLADAGLRLRRRRLLRRRSDLRHARRFRRAGRARACARPQGASSTRSIRTARTSTRGSSESRSSRDNPKADWYVWADAKPDGSPPNNWQSVFGGPAWTWDARRGQYYLHNFLDRAAATSTSTIRRCRTRCSTSARFWLDRGVDGFRLDAINFAMHDPQLRDNPPAPTGRQADAAVRFPAAALQPVAPRHRALPRAHPRADRRLWRPLHPGRSRRRAARCAR